VDAETRQLVDSARIVTKAAIKHLKTELQVLTQLLEQLDNHPNARPLQGGAAHERHREPVPLG
jgi:hypothetical protein